MPSTANEKRAALQGITDYTKTFHKDWQRLTHSGRYNMKTLKQVMLRSCLSEFLGVSVLTRPFSPSFRADK